MSVTVGNTISVSENKLKKAQHSEEISQCFLSHGLTENTKGLAIYSVYRVEIHY